MPTERVALCANDFDRRMLGVVAAHVQATRRTPFCTPADALREALKIAAETLARRSGAVVADGSNAA